MPRDFNIRFDNVEVIGGSDNLLENTNVTKVSMVGDNKMSSLGATFKNCKDLDIIEGSINLNGIDVINEILNGTQYVKSIRLENVNSPNISANLSFPHIESINFDKTYNKIAIQNVLGGCVWNIKDINYYGVVGNSVVNETVSVNNDINISILNSLEKTCREFEIHGNTFENLVDGMVERELSDVIEINMDNTKNVFPMKVVNNIRVDKIEGDSLFNLVDGEKVESLDDSVNRVIMNSDGTYVDNKIRKYDIFGMDGNTVQDESNLSNIQSVGELYVDDNNIPILDKDGNKQYKIDIINHGMNMNGVMGRLVVNNKYLNNNTICFNYNNGGIRNKYLLLFIGKIDFSKSNSGVVIAFNQGNKTLKFDQISKTLKFNYPPFGINEDFEIGKINNNAPFCFSIVYDKDCTDGENFKIFFNKSKVYSSNIDNLNNNPGLFFNTIFLSSYNYGCNGLNVIYSQNSYNDNNINHATDIDKINDYDIKSILLPFPLMRIKDSCDKLYWKNNNYFVEKNISIDPRIFDGSEQWRVDTYIWGEGCKRFESVNGLPNNIMNNNFNEDKVHITNLYKTNNQIDSEGIRGCHVIGRNINIVDKFQTVQELREYLTANNLLVYYVLNKPQLIKLNSPQYFVKSTVSNTNNLKIGRTELCNGANNIILKSGNKAFYDINLKSNTLYTIQLDLFLENDLTPSQLSINLGGKILNENITEDVFNKLIKITTNSTLTNNNLTIVGEGLICQNVMLFETDLKVAVGKYVNGEQHVGEEIIDYFDGKEIEINNPQYKYKLENIVGNTWQDYNTPNSLKSVGELYVDSGGLPILDINGKEQYKVDVVASNKGLTSNIKKTILLPKQLHYIKTLYNGEVANTNNTIVYDELYWDNDFNKYMIKENIKEYISPTINYNGSEFKLNMPSDISLVADVLDSEFIMDGVRVKGWISTSVNTDFAISVFKGNKNCRLATTGTFTNLEVSQKLSNKKILYQTTKPKIIETNITEKLTFNDIDYFTPYTKFELDNFKSDIKLSNKYYLIDLKTSTYDINGGDIVW